MTRRGIPIAITLALIVTGCGAEDAGAPDATQQAANVTAAVPSPGPANGGALTLGTAACRFEPGENPIPAGAVTFAVTFAVANLTEVLGVFNVASLEGGSFQELAAHVADEIELAKAGEPGLGHPSYAVPLTDVLVEPGETAELTATLEPGTHALACGKVYEEVGEIKPSMVIGPVEVGVG